MFSHPNSRRIAVPATLLLATLAVTACSTHACRCYLLERWGNVPIEETLIDINTPCFDLGYDTPHPFDSSFRYCTDADAPLMDTMDIVRMFWGEKNSPIP